MANVNSCGVFLCQVNIVWRQSHCSTKYRKYSFEVLQWTMAEILNLCGSVALKSVSHFFGLKKSPAQKGRGFFVWCLPITIIWSRHCQAADFQFYAGNTNSCTNLFFHFHLPQFRFDDVPAWYTTVYCVHYKLDLRYSIKGRDSITEKESENVLSA